MLLTELDQLVVRLGPPLVVVPQRGVILDQDAPVIVDGERDLEDVVPGLVHPDGVVVVNEPLDRSVRVSALCAVGRFRDGQFGLGGIRGVQLEMQQAVVAEATRNVQHRS